ncbi:nucleoside triphosphate pyrophosphatase [Alcanivorax sp. DP30]|uniref:Maf family protein n=1 Tax=Alcanivorax sp. DP30 TaxID=2606217 RepID=UPI00136976AA|nr:nucleoside triphosphate pyrophosphatase [Alcanivorax sp. DP30]MZR64246.1 septum formation inhibitor Maf [Alcanivorax sp. DP30]
MTLYLASGSPRRAELLQQIAVPFTVLKAPDIDETPRNNELPQAYVERMAKEKSRVGEQRRQMEGLPDGAVLGADTAVVLDNAILGKPRDRDHAMEMLAALSGVEHEVMSALALTCGNAVEVACSITRVRFRELDEQQLARYVDTGEGDDKAGGYGIQGLGGALVAQISGSYSGVVGLPLEQTVALLEQVGIEYWRID